MPRVGQPLAPAPSDIEEVLATSAPLDSVVPFDPAMESEYTGSARRSTVTHTAAGRITLYNYLGDDRVVAVEDLALLVDPQLSTDRRLHLRCPKCVNLPNGGLHPFAGPNGCPGKDAVKFMVCPICASRGFNKRVYEEITPESTSAEIVDTDPNYEAYELPEAADRKHVLQQRLELHMATSHPTEAQARWGIRREPTGDGRGWRIVKS